MGAAAAAVLLALVLTGGEDGPATPQPAEASTGQTAFALFPEFHAVLTVTPAVVGENRVELVLAGHDGTPTADADVTVVAGRREYAAEPVAGSPGSYGIPAVAFDRAGDWELTVTASVAGAEPASQTTTVTIGAP